MKKNSRESKQPIILDECLFIQLSEKLSEEDIFSPTANKKDQNLGIRIILSFYSLPSSLSYLQIKDYGRDALLGSNIQTTIAMISFLSSVLLWQLQIQVKMQQISFLAHSSVWLSFYISQQSFSKAARSSLASENSPSSMPSPTYQCTNALLAYIRSNLWSSLAKTLLMAVELLIMQQERVRFAMLLPGTATAGWQLMPTLKPVGHQSTNLTVFEILTLQIALPTSLGIMSPRQAKTQAMYLPCRGSHLAIMLAGSNSQSVSYFGFKYWKQAFSALTMGEQDDSMKFIRGQGTKLVWNSLRSVLRQPSKRIEAVREDTTCATMRLTLVQFGLQMSRFLLQMPQRASLSRTTETFWFSMSLWVARTELYGSTQALESWGEGMMLKPILVFLPQSTLSRSCSSEPRPEPVPPPSALKIRKP